MTIRFKSNPLHNDLKYFLRYFDFLKKILVHVDIQGSSYIDGSIPAGALES